MYSYLGLSEYLKNVRGCTYKFFRFDTSIPAIERSTINSLGQWYTRSTAVQWYRKLSAVRVHSVKRLPAMYMYCLTAKEPPELCETHSDCSVLLGPAGENRDSSIPHPNSHS